MNLDQKSNSEAFAFNSTCSRFFIPGITADMIGFFKHQAKAHCAMLVLGGTSVFLSFCTNSNCLIVCSLSSKERLSVDEKVTFGSYLPLKCPLAKGILANTPKLFF